MSLLTFGSACGARRSRARRRMGSGQAEFLEPAPRLVQAVEQPDRTIALGDSRKGLGEAFVVRADNESDGAAHVTVGIAAKRAGNRVDLILGQHPVRRRDVDDLGIVRDASFDQLFYIVGEI